MVDYPISQKNAGLIPLFSWLQHLSIKPVKIMLQQTWEVFFACACDEDRQVDTEYVYMSVSDTDIWRTQQ